MTKREAAPTSPRRLRLDSTQGHGQSASQMAGRALEVLGEATAEQIVAWLRRERIPYIPDVGDLGVVLHRRDSLFEPGAELGTWRLRVE